MNLIDELLDNAARKNWPNALGKYGQEGSAVYVEHRLIGDGNYLLTYSKVVNEVGTGKKVPNNRTFTVTTPELLRELITHLNKQV